MTLASKNTSKIKKKEISGIDLFCGAGGLTRGLINGGISIKAGIDIDPDCRFAYEHNNDARYIQKSITDVDPKDLSNFFDKNAHTLLAGCAPCQPFSKYSKGKILDPDKWALLKSFAKLIGKLQPTFVTMENVPQLTDHSIFKTFVDYLRKNDYFVDYRVVYCPDYGVPQNRSRLILLASKLGPISIIKPTHLGKKSSETTVKAAIANLRKITAGQTDSKDPLHQSRKLNELNLKRIRASKPGGTWRDWPKELIAECHKKKSGTTFPSVYGRMSWDKPSPTITTQFFGYGNGRFGHPSQDRAISLREGAILQTFPSDYQFCDSSKPINSTTVGRMIGNAVPVRLGEIIAQSFSEHIKDL